MVWRVSAAGIQVDDLIIQLVGLRYTEPDMTISYPGFLYLLMKLESMIRKGGTWGGSYSFHEILCYVMFASKIMLVIFTTRPACIGSLYLQQ